MCFTRKRLKFELSGLLLLIICASAATGGYGAEEGDAYVFSGVTPLKVYKKQPSPVVGAESKGVLIETNSGVKRVKFGQAGTTLQGTVSATAHFAEVAQFDFYLENFAQQRRETSLQSALDAGASDAQNLVDQLNSNNGQPVAGQPKGVSNESYQSTLVETGASLQELSTAALSRVNQKADTIYLSFELTPTESFETTYALAIVTHDRFDQKGQLAGRAPLSSLEKIGDLEANVPTKVELKLSTREQQISNLEFLFYLFTKDGEPIATNASGKLKKIPLEQLEQVKLELQKRNNS